MKALTLSKRFFITILSLLIFTTVITAQQSVNILIVYYSSTGNTQKMANGVVEGVQRDSIASATLKSVDEVTNDDITAADGIVLGCPTYFGNVANPMNNFLDITGYWGGKVGGAFSTGAMRAGGKEHVVVSLLLALMMKGVIVVGPVYDFGTFQSGAFGATAMTGPPDDGVSESELDDARALGERVAKIAERLKSTTTGNIKGTTNQLPKRLGLKQNYPNPFNPETKINYELPNTSMVQLKIFNSLGEEVQTLVNKEQPAGKYEIRWDGKDNNYNNVATGVYFYRLNSKDNAQTKKMLLLK